MGTLNTKLTQTEIADICGRLKYGKRVQRSLPYDGFIRVDKSLPFLCLYRIPRKSDPLTVKFVGSEASYLILPSTKLKAAYQSLIEQIVELMQARFGACLLIEVWAGDEVEEDQATDSEAVRPVFTIHADTSGELIPTCEALEAGLQKIKVLKKRAIPSIQYSRVTRPPGMPPLLPKSELVALNCHSLGLEIQPIYRSAQNDEEFPLVFRKLHRGIAQALKLALFEFTRTNTRHDPSHYHAMGPKSLTKSSRDIDRKLAEISDSYSFLMLVTPINTEQSWGLFKRNGFQKAPVLHYRPLPIDPAHLKRKLYQIDLDKVSDPTLSHLFRQKRAEIDRELTMLSERNSPNFMLSSLQLYGRVDDAVMASALEILDKFAGRSADDTFGGRHSATEFAQRARDELDKYSAQLGAPVKSEVHVTDQVSGLICSGGHLYIGNNVHLPGNRIEALLQHEVGTHILTYINGIAQPLQLLASGLDGYDELQEGLAVLAEYLVGELSRPRLRLLAGRVAAARYLEQGHSFIDTFRMLQRNHDFEQRTAYRITVRIYRGGGLVKDAIYLRGLLRLLKYLENGGDLKLLYIGKYGFEHIPVINELLHRGLLNQAQLMPSFYLDSKVQKRLDTIRKGISLADMMHKPN